MNPLLDIRNLAVVFGSGPGAVTAVNDLTLSVAEGETLAVVGESGCGKSVTAYSILRLVRLPGRIVSGEIRYDGSDLLKLPEDDIRRIRGDRISMIFQEPMTSLNPVFPVGDQIAEAIRSHREISPAEARDRAVELLKTVSIPAPERRYRDYPHQLSGGMRQRVMIALALSCRPRLLIADEPTTALDVTIQAQILELIDELKRETGMGLILITHDLGVVAEHSLRTAVMYAGRLVELAPTVDILTEPLHPYTGMLLASLPQRNEPGEPLKVISGQVSAQRGGGALGCSFAERCPLTEPECLTGPPALRELRPGHFVRCRRAT
jgi:oligopeptide/dipeptide ABC transporter ATP-binding protein